jgi:hypothetical protein
MMVCFSLDENHRRSGKNGRGEWPWASLPPSGRCGDAILRPKPHGVIAVNPLWRKVLKALVNVNAGKLEDSIGDCRTGAEEVVARLSPTNAKRAHQEGLDRDPLDFIERDLVAGAIV